MRVTAAIIGGDRSDMAVSRVALWLIGLIALCYMLIALKLPLLGDDMGYGTDMANYYAGDLRYFPRWVARHWVFTNGRFPNFLLPPFLYYLPRWLTALCDGAAMGIFYYLTVYLAGYRSRRHATGDILIVSLLLFTLPWWDSFFLFAVRFNYVWAMVPILLLLLLLKSESPVNGKAARWGAYAVAFLGGCGHEAMSVPMVVALTVYFIVNRNLNILSPFKRKLLVAFAIGVAVVVLSPGLLGRLGATGSKAPDAPTAELLTVSAFYVYALGALVVYSLIFKRQRLSELLHSWWLVPAVAAVASLPVIAVGGIIGRSGFFTQVYALIAIGMWLRGCDIRLPRTAAGVLSVVMSVAITAHCIELYRWQSKLSNETNEVLTAFDASDDGVVYYDYTPLDRLPDYLLKKVHGVPNCYDEWTNLVIYHVVGDSLKALTVLPTRLHNLSNMPEELTPVGDGYNYITADLPAGASDTIPGYLGRRTMAMEGKEYMLLPVSTPRGSYYFVTPKIYDPSVEF